LEPEIAQAMVYGDRKPHIVALVVPDAEFAKEWAKETGNSAELSSIIENEDFHRYISETIDRVNEHLSVVERVRRFVLIDQEFTVDNEMMTPTLKVRRHVITEKYGERLEALYGH
jgi:long-chain acyl-CoA synthetase